MSMERYHSGEGLTSEERELVDAYSADLDLMATAVVVEPGVVEAMEAAVGLEASSEAQDPGQRIRISAAEYLQQNGTA